MPNAVYHKVRHKRAMIDLAPILKTIRIRHNSHSARLSFVAFLLLAISTFFLVSSFVLTPAVTVRAGGGPGWKQIFNDDFNSFDSTKWDKCYWWMTDGGCTSANGELEWYQSDDAYVTNGMLQLKAERRSVNGHEYTSGMIDSYHKFTFTYGYMEARLQIPKGQGLWPAFWAIPEDRWPPEIDAMEILGNDPNTAYFGFHYPNSNGTNDHSGTNWTGPDFSAGFHTFAVDWEPDVMIWYIDGVERQRYTDTSHIPNIPLYLVANLAVGGDWPGNPDSTTPFPSYMNVDYIRVWQRCDTCTAATNTPAPGTINPTNTLVPPTNVAPGTGTGTGLAAAYYDNNNFTTLKINRTDPTVNFQWWSGSPDASIGGDTFSARWTGQVQPLYSQTYTFYTTSDDGARLWVNGQLVIDSWASHPPLEASGTISLTAGQKYDFKLEYHEDGGDATLQLSWSSASQPKQIIPQSQLYPAAAAVTSVPTQVSIPPTNTPVPPTNTPIPPTKVPATIAPTKVPPTKTPIPPTKVPPTTVPTSAPTNVAPGTGTGTGLAAAYYDNNNFTTLKINRTDPTVNFQWWNGSPDASIGGDTFSARWTGQVQPLYSQTYTFYTNSDDGTRLWVNGQLVIDSWASHPPLEASGTISLTAGQKYDIKLEYHEDGGDATLQLSWSSASQPKQIIPQCQLYPAAAAAPTSVPTQVSIPPTNTPVPPTKVPATIAPTRVPPTIAPTKVPPTVVPTNSAPVNGTGTGLAAAYYDDNNFTTLKINRTDPTVNFQWWSGSPDPSIGAETYTVRWTGKVQPLYSQTYTFYTNSDDGTRLWVNGQLITDNWASHGPTEFSGTINLAAGQMYDIKLEYHEEYGDATMILSWSSASQPKQIIPQCQLYPASVTTAAVAAPAAAAPAAAAPTQTGPVPMSVAGSGDPIPQPIPVQP